MVLSAENLESITRPKWRLHPCTSSPAFWWVEYEHRSCKRPQHSGNVSGLLVTLCIYNSKELVHSAWCCFAAVDSQSQPVPPSEIRTPCWAWTANQRSSHPRCQADRAGRTLPPPTELKPQPRGYGHVQRAKHKPKHTYRHCSKPQLQFKSSSSTTSAGFSFK